ncbi:glycosyltransferase family 2 protein [Allisonella histaminiformans]|uniref:glycosyltransferase family 2 protein n=1 Tax=Allisonella histaminiformans TaxID=209880 RepID=UPI002E765A10|nr:glycosyltransferase family 2 protein [Allisonella histaminiformans]
MQISVIVPVYNVEKYLQRCVKSLMLQTYREIEILLIDDGSTDKSGLICDELASQDRRIHAFHKENEGVSSARNLGIEKASGDYICFVDSDDWLEVDYFEKAVPVLIKKQPMLLINNYLKDDGKGNVFCKFSQSPVCLMMAEEAFFEMVDGSRFGWEPVASFYKAFGCKKVRFDRHIVFGEDLLFRFQYTQANEGLYIYQYLPKYHYFMRMDSAVNSYAIYKKIDDMKVIEQIMAETNEKTRHLLLVKEYIPRLIHYYVLGSQSNDCRDNIVAKELQNKIRDNIWCYCGLDTLGSFMKLKLIICLFPQSIVKFIWRRYQRLKNALE